MSLSSILLSPDRQRMAGHYKPCSSSSPDPADGEGRGFFRCPPGCQGLRRQPRCYCRPINMLRIRRPCCLARCMTVSRKRICSSAGLPMPDTGRADGKYQPWRGSARLQSAARRETGCCGSPRLTYLAGWDGLLFQSLYEGLTAGRRLRTGIPVIAGRC